jgi:NADPH:quinone reductase-like Zn-dependent oxidoreductase
MDRAAGSQPPAGFLREVAMKALLTNGYGPPTNLTIAEVETPFPATGQVLIEVAAASVNPFDLQLIQGNLKDVMPLTFPYVVGMDCAGTVTALGDEVSRFSVGDPVFGMLRGTAGAMAQYAVAGAGSPLLARRPAGLDPTRAAAIPEVGMTALTLMRAAALEPGETALVIGATGGIGMVLVPLASAAGAAVVATANADDDAYVRRLGAADTIDYTTTDTIAETLRRHPRGVDVVFNLALDGPDIVHAAGAVRAGGRLVSAPPVWDKGAFRDDIAVASPFLSAEPGDLEELGARAASGALPVEVAELYPLERAGQAFVDHAGKHTRGKLVVAVL